MSKNPRIRLTKGQKEILREYLKKNPDATWKEYKEAMKGIKGVHVVSDAYFYTARRELHGSDDPRMAGKRKSSPLYLSIWQYSTERLGNESRAMLQDLVDTLNSQKRTRWQLVELKNPAVLELREVQMSSSHKAFIASLQRDGHWLVSGWSSTQMILTKVIGGKHGVAASVLLEANRSGMYTVSPATYAFRSTLSHFDYPTEEERRIRNKAMFKSLIRTLKRVGIWEGVENKDTFVRINHQNKKSNKNKLRHELSSFLK